MICMGVQKWKDGGGAEIQYCDWSPDIVLYMEKQKQKNQNYNGITLLNLFPPSSAVDQAVYDS